MNNMNTGYHGWSMSNRAQKAYSNGEMPISKWTKNAIMEAVYEELRDEQFQNFKANTLSLKVAELRSELLRYSSWHHTSKFCNRTDFYSLDLEAVKALASEATPEALAKLEALEAKKATRQAQKAEKEAKAREVYLTKEKAENEAREALKSAFKTMVKTVKAQSEGLSKKEVLKNLQNLASQELKTDDVRGLIAGVGGEFYSYLQDDNHLEKLVLTLTNSVFYKFLALGLIEY